MVGLVSNKIPNQTCFATDLEEQQEREVELEKEVQVQLDRPVIKHPCAHQVHLDVLNLVAGNGNVHLSEGLIKLPIPFI